MLVKCHYGRGKSVSGVNVKLWMPIRITSEWKGFHPVISVNFKTVLKFSSIPIIEFLAFRSVPPIWSDSLHDLIVKILLNPIPAKWKRKMEMDYLAQEMEAIPQTMEEHFVSKYTKETQIWRHLRIIFNKCRNIKLLHTHFETKHAEFQIYTVYIYI